MRKRTAVALGIVVGAAAALLADSRALSQPHLLETVPHVDLKRYVGRWYEIARYPNWFERKCDRDVTAEYAIKSNGDVSVVNSCFTSNAKEEKSVGTAKIVDSASNAKLKVSFFWPFYGNYWIIALGDDYEYAAVGEPSRKYLWILSRTPSMDDAKYQNILRQVSSKAYDQGKLVRTTQTAGPDRQAK